MRSSHSRRSRAGPSDDDSPPENRQRPVQKSVQYIPEEHFPTRGERWISAPPRRKSCKASTNNGASAPKIENCLFEFKLDMPPTSLTPDDRARSIPPVHSHSSRPTKRKNRRTNKRVPRSTSPLQQSRASTEETGPDTSTSGSFSTSLQAEPVATSTTLSGGSIAPGIGFYPVPQGYDSRDPLIHYQQVPAGSLALYDTMGSPQSQAPAFPETTVGWTPETGSVAYYYHGPDSYIDAMGHGSFLLEDTQ